MKIKYIDEKLNIIGKLTGDKANQSYYKYKTMKKDEY